MSASTPSSSSTRRRSPSRSRSTASSFTGCRRRLRTMARAVARELALAVVGTRRRRHQPPPRRASRRRRPLDPQRGPSLGDAGARRAVRPPGAGAAHVGVPLLRRPQRIVGQHLARRLRTAPCAARRRPTPSATPTAARRARSASRSTLRTPSAPPPRLWCTPTPKRTTRAPAPSPAPSPAAPSSPSGAPTLGTAPTTAAASAPATPSTRRRATTRWLPPTTRAPARSGCYAPPRDTAGAVELFLALNGQNYARAARSSSPTRRCCAGGALANVRPSGGGTIVRVTLPQHSVANMNDGVALKCRFGGAVVPAYADANKELRCQAPPAHFAPAVAELRMLYGMGDAPPEEWLHGHADLLESGALRLTDGDQGSAGAMLLPASALERARVAERRLPPLPSDLPLPSCTRAPAPTDSHSRMGSCRTRPSARPAAATGCASRPHGGAVRKSTTSSSRCPAATGCATSRRCTAAPSSPSATRTRCYGTSRSTQASAPTATRMPPSPSPTTASTSRRAAATVPRGAIRHIQGTRRRRRGRSALARARASRRTCTRFATSPSRCGAPSRRRPCRSRSRSTRAQYAAVDGASATMARPSSPCSSFDGPRRRRAAAAPAGRRWPPHDCRRCAAAPTTAAASAATSGCAAPSPPRPTRCTARAPKGEAPLAAAVTLTLNGQQYHALPSNLTRHAPGTLTAASSRARARRHHRQHLRALWRCARWVGRRRRLPLPLRGRWRVPNETRWDVAEAEAAGLVVRATYDAGERARSRASRRRRKRGPSRCSSRSTPSIIGRWSTSTSTTYRSSRRSRRRR